MNSNLTYKVQVTLTPKIHKPLTIADVPLLASLQRLLNCKVVAEQVRKYNVTLKVNKSRGRVSNTA